MARNISHLTGRTTAYDEATLVNEEGFPAFDRGIQARYLQMLLTNTVSNTFYVDAKDLAAESHSLHKQAVKEDQTFAAKAIVYARNEGFMRLQPILGLVYLSLQNSELFQLIFPHVVRTPGDLQDFIELIHRGDIRGLGRSPRRAIRDWLNNMSEYHALKYAGGGQGFALRDVLRLAHPKPANEKQQAIFNWLAQGWKDGMREVIPQIAFYEDLKSSDIDALYAIEHGRLPHEVVTGLGNMTIPAWKALAREMPYFALLRHLVTLQRQDALDADLCAYIAERLGDAKAVKRAKVLPFRLFSAIKKFDARNADERGIEMALWDALEASEIPEIKGNKMVAVDISGSMSGSASGGSVTYIDIASLFAGALMKQDPRTLLMPFANRVREHHITGRSQVDTMNQLVEMARIPEGTTISAPIQKLLDNRTAVDHAIIITDQQEWSGRGFLPVWREYKRKVSQDAKAWIVAIAPYRSHITPENEPSASHIYGWNDSVLKFIGRDENAQIAYINEHALDDIVTSS